MGDPFQKVIFSKVYVKWWLISAWNVVLSKFCRLYSKEKKNKLRQNLTWVIKEMREQKSTETGNIPYMQQTA